MTSPTANAAALKAWADDYRSWFLDAAAPLWSGNGRHASGGFHEALSFAGTPVPSDTARVRVQGRQIYLFCAAHEMGWDGGDTHHIVDRGVDFMLTACRRPDGLFGRTVSLDAARLRDATADLYDTAFCLFALGHARAVLGGRVDGAIGDVMAALDRELAYDDGAGFRETLPAPPHRLQNPHMHLLESAMTVHDRSGGRLGRPLVDALYGFIDRQFFEHDDGWVKERTDGRGAPLDHAFEPGHSFEWVWLLGWHAKLTGTPVPPFQRMLYDRAVPTLDSAGLACMKVGLDGDKVDPSCRLWSQTEALKAHLAMTRSADTSTAAAALDAAVAGCQRIKHDWLDAADAAGGWLDHFDASGRLLAKDMPASSGYHIVSAIAELRRTAEDLAGGR